MSTAVSAVSSFSAPSVTYSLLNQKQQTDNDDDGDVHCTVNGRLGSPVPLSSSCKEEEEGGKTPAAAAARPAGQVGGGHVATTMPAMKMSSWMEEQEDRGDALPVLFSASSSSWISWSRQLALQNAFSPR